MTWKTVKNKKKKQRVYKKPKPPKNFNGGTWTQSKFFGTLRSSLRRTFRWWIPMQKALEKASRPSQNKQNKRLKKEYQCAHCKDWFKRQDVEIDHKIECGSLKNWDDVVPFIQRMTAEDVNAYQVLCIHCHKIKTTEVRLNKLKNEK